MKKLLALGVASLLLAGCSSSGTTSATPSPASDATTMDTTQTTGSSMTYVSPVPTDMPTGSPTTAAVGKMLADGSLQVKLDAQNASGQSGTATFAPSTDGTKVTVTLALTGGAFTAAQPAHIHEGSCPAPGAVKYPLTDVVNGKSVTTLSVSMANLLKTAPKLAVNVHKSAADISSYTSCGNIQ